MLVVRRGVSRAGEATQIAAELAEQVRSPDAAAVLVFTTSRGDVDALAAALAKVFHPIPVYGCTTAGEIGPGGFSTRSAVAMSLAAPGLRIGHGIATGLDESPLSEGRTATLRAIESLGLTPTTLDGKRHVAVSLVDGRSGQEESFIAGAAGPAPSIRFVGGSASDDPEASPAARIIAGGRALSDAGLILVLESPVPFYVIKSEHMEPYGDPVVVTASEPAERLVHELNGRPARAVYASLLGVPPEDVTTVMAAHSPFAYYVAGRPYVRSVMSLEGQSLRFASAVGDGVVLRLMRAGDILARTRESLDEARRSLGGIGAMIAFSCVGRYYETEALGLTTEMGEELTRDPMIGFNTFGEQINALHMNHTLCALAFGKAARG